MSFELPALLKLGAIDQKLHVARKRLAKAGDIAAPQRARVAAAEAELVRLKDETKVEQRNLKMLEGDQKAKEAEILKTNVTLNGVKNNDEYQALLRTIASKQHELSEIETKILEAYDAQETRDQAEAAGKTRLATQQKELKSAQGRVSEEEAAARAEIETLEAQRVEAAGALEAKYLKLYEKTATKHENVTAEIVGEMCQGCFVKVRPNQISLARGGKEMVTCTDCGRILFMQAR